MSEDSAAGVDPIADTAAQRELRMTVREVIARVSPPQRIRELDEREEFDQQLFEALGEAGLTALGGDPAFGGHGDICEQAVVIEELAKGPTSMAVYMVVHFMGNHILSHDGSRQQREQWLSRLIDGSAKASFALTEPGGGTDSARAMRTRATRTEDGWLLNGHKRWIGGTNTADVLLVLARTAETTGSSIDGITMFAVPGGSQGAWASVLPTVSIRGFDTTEIRFEDVALPADAVVGNVSKGFRQVLSTLNRERINAAAGAIGAAGAAHAHTVEHVRGREAFGSTLGSFQVIQHRLVDGAIALESARSLLVRAARLEAAEERADLLSSMAKIAATEAAVKITQDGLECLGGIGLSRDEPMQRWFRDVRLWVFAPIANDMLRNYLGERLLGLPRSF
jgi:acyl-CoA dehydrogenase